MKVVSGEVFTGSRNGMHQVTVELNGGTATLEALTGEGTAVSVTDGVLAEGITTFYAVSDQQFIITLAGGAEAWVTG